MSTSKQMRRKNNCNFTLKKGEREIGEVKQVLTNEDVTDKGCN